MNNSDYVIGIVFLVQNSGCVMDKVSLAQNSRNSLADIQLKKEKSE